MIGDVPRIPDGQSSEAVFMRWVRENILSMRSMSVPGALVSRTTRGTFLRPNAISVSGGTSPATPALELTLRMVASDYVAGSSTTPGTISSITHSGTTASVTTSAPHGLSSGTLVAIWGCTPSSYNGVYVITRTGSTTFTYQGGTGSSASAVGSFVAVICAAKNWKHRCSRSGETGPDATTYTFSYAAASTTTDPFYFSSDGKSGNQVRTKTGGGNTESETIAPEWDAGDVFYAIPATTTVNTPAGHAQYIVGGESRNWTAPPVS